MPNSRFKPHHPRPDPEVVEMLERVLKAARLGYVKTLAIIAVNPLHQVETGIVGDLSKVRATAVLGGLARTASQILTGDK